MHFFTSILTPALAALTVFSPSFAMAKKTTQHHDENSNRLLRGHKPTPQSPHTATHTLNSSPPSSSSFSSSSDGDVLMEGTFMLDSFAIEHGIKQGSTLDLYYIDPQTQYINVDDKRFSLIDGLNEEEDINTTNHSLHDKPLTRTFSGHNGEDSIKIVKDSQGNIKSVKVLMAHTTSDTQDKDQAFVQYKMVPLEKDLLVRTNLPNDDEQDNSDSDNTEESNRNHRRMAGYCKLCVHYPCTDQSLWKSTGWYSSMPWQVPNDTLSFVYIQPGTFFRYWEDVNFGGWNRSFGSRYHEVNLWMGGHNDTVSSFMIGTF